MRLAVMSDLHLEHGGVPPAIDPSCEVVILAGDIDRGSRAWQSGFLASLAKHSQVIYVPGNHEYFHTDATALRRNWAAMDDHRIHVLDDRAVILGGVRFVGATLWTPAEGDAEEVAHMARHHVLDYRSIHYGRRKLQVRDTRHWHQRSLCLLQKVLAEPFAGPTVVISHHLPSQRSISPRFADSPRNLFFASRLDWLIERYQPELWVHGHSHSRMDYHIGTTRVLCHPRGYPGECDPGYTPRILTLDSESRTAGVEVKETLIYSSRLRLFQKVSIKARV